MRIIFFVLLLAVIFLTGCARSPDFQTELTPEVATPIEGVLSDIVAQGYVMIHNRRYSPVPPVISFHPYPAYFALFPFAVWNGVPHFSLTNSVDDFFKLLGKERADVPADRFGNQRIDNVTAVFNNFTQHSITDSDFIFVNAEITGLVDDWTGDEWEIVYPDFVLVTNGDRTIEPIQMRVGDEFLGLELIRIESSQAFLKNGEIYYQLSAEAEVSDQITFEGDLSIGLHFESDYRVRIDFTVADEFLPLLPRIADFREGSKSIPIHNIESTMSALGVTREELDIARSIEFTGVTVTLKISCVSSFGYDGYFVELQS